MAQTGKVGQSGKQTEADAREARLAAALRANLQKRKQQARARKASDDAQREAGADAIQPTTDNAGS